MNSSKSKYIRISQEIIARIESGELRPGDRVPSENELIQQYGISNTTARKSLLDVELKGWVTRIKGKGTFVLNRSKEMHLTRILGSLDAIKESFEENLIHEGFTPKTILMEKTIIENGISTNVNGRIFSIEGPVLKYHRLRYANDILMKDDTRYISMTACKNIHLVETGQPLVRLYEEKYKLKIENIHRTISTTILYPDAADNYFENELPLPAFILNGVCMTGGGEIIEIEYSLYHGDKYRFAIDVKPQLFPPPSIFRAADEKNGS
ncbi:GntR family transcriptional regulator [Alistipes timonensis]